MSTEPLLVTEMLVFAKVVELRGFAAAARQLQLTTSAVSRSVGRLEAHYMRHGAFFTDNQLIRNVGRIRHLPAVIIQGRYDVVCPPCTAWALHQAWPEASFQVVEDAGHAAFEPGIASALVAATDRFKRGEAL